MDNINDVPANDRPTREEPTELEELLRLYIRRLHKIQRRSGHDTEQAHSDADEVLCDAFSAVVHMVRPLPPRENALLGQFFNAYYDASDRRS
jgi:hypothetical protein